MKTNDEEPQLRCPQSMLSQDFFIDTLTNFLHRYYSAISKQIKYLKTTTEKKSSSKKDENFKNKNDRILKS